MRYTIPIIAMIAAVFACSCHPDKEYVCRCYNAGNADSVKQNLLGSTRRVTRVYADSACAVLNNTTYITDTCRVTVENVPVKM